MSGIPGTAWRTAIGTTECFECERAICPGERYLAYSDMEAADLITHRRIINKRHFCEECGKLLEDSLITTEQVQ